MSRRIDRFHRGTSLVLALLTLVLSVSVPMLERGALTGETAVESEHDPARCAHTHDHRICTQVSANLSLASSKTEHRLSHILVRSTPAADVTATPRKSPRQGPPSRAPPLA